jgi:hypothetical protein
MSRPATATPRGSVSSDVIIEARRAKLDRALVAKPAGY